MCHWFNPAADCEVRYKYQVRKVLLQLQIRPLVCQEVSGKPRGFQPLSFGNFGRDHSSDRFSTRA
jgi:hypothetical protein